MELRDAKARSQKKRRKERKKQKKRINREMKKTGLKYAHKS